MIFQSGYDITRGKTKTLGPVLMMISSIKVGSPFIKRMFKKLPKLQKYNQQNSLQGKKLKLCIKLIIFSENEYSFP